MMCASYFNGIISKIWVEDVIDPSNFFKTSFADAVMVEVATKEPESYGEEAAHHTKEIAKFLF